MSIWCMFSFMTVVLTVQGSVGMFVVYRGVVKDSVFYPWSAEVCYAFV